MDDELVIRKSQAVSPFGVGAMFEVLGQSFVACDTTFWSNTGKRIDLSRLAKTLNVEFFKLPPTNSDFKPETLKEYVPFVRFPLWNLCASCRRVTKTKKSESASIPTCQYCSGKRRLAPIRYVKICKSGHMSDIDWHYWTHHTSSSSPEQQQCKDYGALIWKSTRAGKKSKQGEYVECRTCGAQNFLLELVKLPLRCEGSQPWLRSTHNCDEQAIARPRGATNIHFPFMESALDIPESASRNQVGSEEESRVKAHRSFNQLLTMTSASSIYRTKILQVSNETGVSVESVQQILLQEPSQHSREQLGPGSLQRLEVGEWAAFHDDEFLRKSNDSFVARKIDFREASNDQRHLERVTSLISRVVVVDKLREVRALTGFSRFEPNREKLISPSLAVRANWLPAIEVYGEGIFVTLDQEKVLEWERREAVKKQVDKFLKLSGQSFWGDLLPQPTGRLILLHTIAHLLIRQLSFSCGYSSSALRERIYSSIESESEKMCGLLIYTSSGDSEGSLGGLAREGEPHRLLKTLVSAIRNADWCTSDPVCGELWSGPGSLNHAACHACSLLPETSCQFRNLLLNRSFVIGSDGSGYFDEIHDVLFSDLRLE